MWGLVMFSVISFSRFLLNECLIGPVRSGRLRGVFFVLVVGVKGEWSPCNIFFK